MRIKEYHSRQELERWPTSRIKRAFMIARFIKFTRTRLIDKVMKKMGEVFPEAGLELKEKLENTRWQDLKREYSIPSKKGLTKEKAIEMILAGEYTLDDSRM